MNIKEFKSDLLLLTTALIWGFAFVAQREGMVHVGPMLFNGVRFLLGGISLLPLLIFSKIQHFNAKVLIRGTILGVILFIASSFQQFGVKYTTAGKAGFITGLYVIIVPIFSHFIGKKTSTNKWIASILAVIGLLFISETKDFSIMIGDLLVFISAFFWASHILYIEKFVENNTTLMLSVTQFFVCGFLSFISALFLEEIHLSQILLAKIPILYGGLMSVGVAYTLQIKAQKTANPTHAAIILSLEGFFAVLGGWLILSEIITLRILIGCSLMFSAMIIAQLNKK